jgi:hypothetical protein
VCDTHVVEGAEHGFTSCDGTAFLRFCEEMISIAARLFYSFYPAGPQAVSVMVSADLERVELVLDLKWPSLFLPCGQRTTVSVVNCFIN